MNQIAKKIARTKLKFVESEVTGDMIAYVTINPETGRVFGVKQDDELPKKIVLISKQVSDSMEIKPKTLYDAEIVPMGKHQNRKSCRGFIVVSLSPSLFEATVSLDKWGAATVSFGNKTIVYDPTSTKPSRNNKEAVIKVLSDREDINDKELVIAQFISLVDDADRLHEERYQSNLQKLVDKHAAA